MAVSQASIHGFLSYPGRISELSEQIGWTFEALQVQLKGKERQSKCCSRHDGVALWIRF